ncbi:hypothetical protein [Luteibacter yeojuensis]|uniref:Uncharacterized protein n=1 Tax=Luteibacter yeojuensis TaxID=345309 RepID=A0A0F3KJ51_9GAMM|nr:hypothetical protein [Luteibacter yeojuensis]KJV31290.1 hypothetical protein VI08_13600 [Luteibacter yeojuensis]
METLDNSYIARFEAIHTDAIALGDAALAEDFDEARFGAKLLIARAESLGMASLVHAAKVIEATLGESGEPLPGYGAAILGVAKTLRPSIRKAT